MGDNELLTLVKAAEIARCDTSTLRRSIGKGKLHAKRYGHNWLVTRQALEAWMNSPHRQPKKNPHK